MSQSPKNINVCFTPAVYNRFHNPDAIVVVVDILRATSAICTAFINGARLIIPVGSLTEAKSYKKKGYLIAAERDGIVCDFADFGNSPSNFSREMVEGKTIVYSTTNGTKTIHLGSECHKVSIGSFLNLNALVEWLIKENKDVVVLCSGWKDRFSLEDSVFCGALSQKLLESGQFETICDSTIAAVDLWSIAKNDLNNYMKKAANRNRLKKLGLGEDIEYCHTLNLTDIIPVLTEEGLVAL